MRYRIDRRDEVFISYMELRSLTAEDAAGIISLRKAYAAELRAILTRGVASGQFAIADPAVTAMALIAMLTGVTIWRKPGGRLAPDAIGDIYAALCLSAVGAQAAAPKVKSGQRAR